MIYLDVYLIWLAAALASWVWLFVVLKYFPNLRLKEPFRKGTTVSRGDTVFEGDTIYAVTGAFTYEGEDPSTRPYLEKMSEV